MEFEICRAILRFEQEVMKVEPVAIHALVGIDVILVKVEGTLTPAERQLGRDRKGLELVRQFRRALLDQVREDVAKIIAAVTNVEVHEVFTDVSASSNEDALVFTMNGNLKVNRRQRKRQTESRRGR